MIGFTGELTETEFRRLQWLFVGKFVKILPWLILAAFVITALTGGYRVFAEDPVKYLVGCLPGIAFMAFFFLAPRWAIRRSWQQNRAIKGQTTGIVSDSGIEWNNPFLQAKFPWNVLLYYREDKRIVLVFIAPNSALFFPRTFFASEENWVQFRELVATRLARK